MKKVLILAYDFPPYVSVGGLRPYSWYAYFHRFGVYPIVVTRQWSNKHGNVLDYVSPSETDSVVYEQNDKGLIIRTPYKPNLANRLFLKYGQNKYSLFRRSITALYEIFQWFFNVGPKSNLYDAANEYLKKNKVDVIIASGEPFILFSYASKLSSKHSLPWIADYRDPWSQNINFQRDFISFIYPILEKKLVSSAYSVVTVSDFFKRKIEKLINNKKFHIIENGYDSDAYGVNVDNKNNELNIALSGAILKWHPIDVFLRVISELIEEDKNIKMVLNFYGINNESEIKYLIENKFKNLLNIVKIYPKISNAELAIELKKNDALLLFNYYSYMGTKIYDYLAAKRKILFCFSDDYEALRSKKNFYNMDDSDENESKTPQIELINETDSGIILKDSTHLKIVIKNLLKEFKDIGHINCNSINTEKHSRVNQVKQLAEIINNIPR